MSALATRTAVGAASLGSLSIQDNPSPCSQLDRSFEQIYASTFDAVYRYALALVRDPDKAEDLASEAYLRAWRNREKLRPNASPLGWLFAVVHNLAVSQLRSHRETTDMSLLFDQEDFNPGPEHRALEVAESERVRNALVQLTAEQQQVVLLRFAMGYSHDEIAAKLGRTSNATRAIQFRALGRLRVLLEEDANAALS